MRQLLVWGNRLQKFRDNPLAIIPFLKKRWYYNFVADSYLSYYSDITFLSYQETINELIEHDRSFVRFGDEAFDMILGIGLYFNGWRQRYEPSLGERYKEVLASSHPKLLVGFNPELILMTRKEFREQGIAEQYQYWTNSKVFLKDYLHPGQIYGSALCFHERYNTTIDYTRILGHLKRRHLIILTSNVARFKNAQLGLTTEYVEGPGSDAWSSYERLLNEVRSLLTKYPKEQSLVLAALGPTSKVLTYDLTLEGYTVWDTGQLFDLALTHLVRL